MLVVALLSFWTVLHLITDAPPALAFAVALAVLLHRATADADLTTSCLGAVVVPAGAAAAACGALWDGALGDGAFVAGAALFVLAVGLGTWLRRFTLAGLLGVVPFVAVLIVPPQVGTLLSLEVGAVVHGWTSLVRWLAAPRTAARRRTTPRTALRMAVQLSTALAVAFAVGAAVFGEHWMWPVPTAYIVCGTGGSRLDALGTGGSRLGGAALGTLLGSAVTATALLHGSSTIVAILLTVGAAVALRPHSYAAWAAGITMALGLFYDLTAPGHLGLLVDRLAGILAGGLIGIVACCVILPLRSSDALRHRTATMLATLDELLAAWPAAGADHADHADHAVHRSAACLPCCAGCRRRATTPTSSPSLAGAPRASTGSGARPPPTPPTRRLRSRSGGT